MTMIKMMMKDLSDGGSSGNRWGFLLWIGLMSSMERFNGVKRELTPF